MFKNGSFALSSEKSKNYKYKKLDEDHPEELGSITENDDECYELQKRSKHLSEKNTLTHQHYDTLVEKPIQTGESLASISLKYRIPVSELKRVNKLQKETEFYALNTLKIPVKLNSALYEMLQEDITNPNAATTGPESTINRASCSSELDSETEIPVGVISISQILREKKTRKEARRFLENMQKDLTKLQNKTCTYKDSLDDAASALTEVAFTSMESRRGSCSGADWDLAWWKVVVGGALVVLGIPGIYLYIYS